MARFSSWRSIFVIVIACMVSMIAVRYSGTNLGEEIGRMRRSVHEYFDPPLKSQIKRKADNENDKWGTFTPSSLFEYTRKYALSPMIRLMWKEKSTGGWIFYEHCDWSVERINWNIHDGKSFGRQTLKGKYRILTTSFLVDENDNDVSEIRIETGSRIYTNKTISRITLYLQITSENGTISLGHFSKELSFIKIRAKVNEEYCVALTSERCSMKLLQGNTLTKRNQLKSSLYNALKQDEYLESNHTGNTGYIVCEGTDDIYISLRIAKLCNQSPMKRHDFWKKFDKQKKRFSKDFSRTFKLSKSSKVYETALVAMSNLLGSIGSFAGSYKIFDTNSINVREENAKLISTTPSRMYHAHGFLWDEGFHNMVLSLWDTDLSLEILANWLDLMDTRGWIPRELILDEYSKLSIPSIYHIQYDDNANPPTLLYPLLAIAKTLAQSQENRSLLKNIYNKLYKWIDWFISSQRGSRELFYRWRGRNLTMNENQTNKMTLASGLDDYPRSLIVDRNEGHLDLRCWIAFAANVTAQIANIVGEDASRYSSLFKELTDEDKLDTLHFDTDNNRYGDFGADIFQSINPSYMIINRIGYVCIFPFLLRLLHPNSEKLVYIMEDIEGRDRLWTNFGLRSLSRYDRYYQKKNDVDDTPQWRGSIRMNINYLALGALKYYATQSTKYSSKMSGLYQRLRTNIIENVDRVYKKQSSFYERYNDMTGDGEGHFPHTSASLFVLILSEEFF